jgi:hypothetical protein
METGNILASLVLASFVINDIHWMLVRQSRFMYFPRAGRLRHTLTVWVIANSVLAALSLVHLVPFAYFAFMMTGYVILLQLYAMYSRRHLVSSQP